MQMLNGQTPIQEMALKDGLMAKSKLKGYLDYVQTVTEKAALSWTSQDSIELFRECSRIVLRSTTYSVFGQEFADSRGDELADMFFALEMSGVNPVTIALPSLPFGKPKECREMRTKIMAILEEEYNRRIKSKNYKDDNYFDSLLRVVEKYETNLGRRPTAELLCQHLASLAFAAHINTAGSLGWGFAHVLTNKELLQSLRKGQHDLEVEFDKNPARRMELEDMPLLKQYESILKEALRLYGVSVYVPRLCKKGNKMNGYTIPEGRLVSLFPLFLEDGLSQYSKFDPSRWESGEMDAFSGSYYQFGVGRHSCLGKVFATNLVKIVWFLVLKNYDITMEAVPVPDYSKNLGVPFPATAPAKVTRRRFD